MEAVWHDFRWPCSFFPSQFASSLLNRPETQLRQTAPFRKRRPWFCTSLSLSLSVPFFCLSLSIYRSLSLSFSLYAFKCPNPRSYVLPSIKDHVQPCQGLGEGAARHGLPETATTLSNWQAEFRHSLSLPRNRRLGKRVLLLRSSIPTTKQQQHHHERLPPKHTINKQHQSNWEQTMGKSKTNKNKDRNERKVRQRICEALSEVARASKTQTWKGNKMRV